MAGETSTDRPQADHTPKSGAPTATATTTSAPATDPAPYDMEKAAESVINMATFEQLLEMDDEDNFEFIKSLVDTFHEQAMVTFADMDEKLASKDLDALSRLGHFLKGSSASVGLRKVPLTCGRIQNYGHLKDDDGVEAITEDSALRRIAEAVVQLKVEYAEANRFYQSFFAADA